MPITPAIKQHPLSAIFPKMPEDEFRLLVEDIRQNGQQEFIVLHEGKILDGQHRYMACLEIGTAPKTMKYSGKDARAFVKSKNWHRRHMTESQRAFAIVGLNEWAERGRPGTPSEGEKPATVAGLAEQAGTGTRIIVQAKRVEEGGSAALKKAVTDGDLPVHKAAAISDLPKSEQKEAIKEALAPAEKSKPKKKAAPKADTVPKEKYDALVEKYDELREEHKELASELEVYEAIKSGAEAKKLKALNDSLKQANRARDDYMNKCNQLQKQVKYLEAELKKLGWKKK